MKRLPRKSKRNIGIEVQKQRWKYRRCFCVRKEEQERMEAL